MDEDTAIERGRSIICRGEATGAVVLTASPHRIASRLNRQSNVWAVAAAGPNLEDVLAERTWNVLCLPATRQSSFALLASSRLFARHLQETST